MEFLDPVYTVAVHFDPMQKPGGILPYLTRRDVLLNRVSICGKNYATGYCNW